MFLTEEGAFVKVDLTTKKMVEYLEIGGKLAMGSFVESKEMGGHGQNSNSENGMERANNSHGNSNHNR
ncbi:MAG: hypothetical protein DSZ11_04885 [Sulfurovum sp.]|nr:MAG: hypothetical protein DSZ11_04885 [Sulfurovum sp.]